ncbi:MAG: hypothetical protein VYE22_40705 [Myxococcota bacterium]|nr:hypothetical protein [Myxococcota bacterium]
MNRASSILSSVAIVACALAAVGCGRTSVVGTQVRHPLHTGAVDRNEVAIGRLPARDRAALVEVTSERICAELELWTRPAGAGLHARGYPESYEIGLVADDDEVEQRDPTIRQAAPRRAARAGLFAPERPGDHVYVPGTVCFPNQGFVGVRTHRLRLELRPHASRGRTLVFQWDLVPAATDTREELRRQRREQVPGREPEVFVDEAPPSQAAQSTQAARPAQATQPTQPDPRAAWTTDDGPRPTVR